MDTIVISDIDLSVNTFLNILNNIKSSQVKQIRILPSYSSSITVQNGISQYKQAFRQIHFDLSFDTENNWLAINKVKDTHMTFKTKLFISTIFILISVIIWISYSSAITMAQTCDANASCHNIFCLFGCHCNVGWIGDGLDCQHICTVQYDICNVRAVCLQSDNLQGFECHCNPGLTGDGINSCIPTLDTTAALQWYSVNDIYANVSDLDHGMVATYDDYNHGIITLLGGEEYPSRRYILNLSTHKVTLVGSIPGLNIQSDGQNSVTVNNMLYYIIEGYLYNINLRTFMQSPMRLMNEEGPQDRAVNRGCITSDHEKYLFMITVHFDEHFYLQIYNIPKGEWSLGAELIEHVFRLSSSCAYWGEQDSIYHFGGRIPILFPEFMPKSRDIFVLQSVMSKNNSWKATSSKLTAKVAETHSFLISKYQMILTIGTVDSSGFLFCNEYNLISGMVKNCHPLDNMMHKKFTPIHLANYDRLYTIGGLIASKRDRFQAVTYDPSNSLKYMNIEQSDHCDSVQQFNTTAQTLAKFQNGTSAIGKWILTNITFDFKPDTVIIGYDENFDKDKIVMLVFWHERTHVYHYQYVFDMKSQTLIKYPKKIEDLHLKRDIRVQSYFTVKNNIYYRFNKALYIYDMFNFGPVWETLIPKRQKHDTTYDCITSDGEKYIYMIGGYFQILNLDTYEWTLGPDLRGELLWNGGACIYWEKQDSIYLFGGFLQINHTKKQSDRILSLSNISDTNSMWKVLDAKLTSETDDSQPIFAFIDEARRTVFIIGSKGRLEENQELLCNEFLLSDEKVRNCVHGINSIRYNFGVIFLQTYKTMFIFGGSGDRFGESTDLIAAEHALVVHDREDNEHSMDNRNKG
eukprot:119116_1